MILTRDSAIWWLGIAGALITYVISVGSSPLAWTHTEWLQFVSVLIGTISGKLATSPLPGKASTTTVTPRLGGYDR